MFQLLIFKDENKSTKLELEKTYTPNKDSFSPQKDSYPTNKDSFSPKKDSYPTNKDSSKNESYSPKNNTLIGIDKEKCTFQSKLLENKQTKKSLCSADPLPTTMCPHGYSKQEQNIIFA